MDIIYKGKFKAITSFRWTGIPKLAIITGKNGTGKSQLLQIIYQSFLSNMKSQIGGDLTVSDGPYDKKEIIYNRSEWQLAGGKGSNTDSYSSIRQSSYKIYSEPDSIVSRNLNEDQKAFFAKIDAQVDKPRRSVSYEEYLAAYPKLSNPNPSEISKEISAIFLNYRILGAR